MASSIRKVGWTNTGVSSSCSRRISDQPVEPLSERRLWISQVIVAGAGYEQVRQSCAGPVYGDKAVTAVPASVITDAFDDVLTIAGPFLSHPVTIRVPNFDFAKIQRSDTLFNLCKIA